MASKLSFLINSFTEIRNNKAKEKSGTDEELALVKAAAWAWHEHSSGPHHDDQGNAVMSSELKFDANSRTRRHLPRPSRYKLEALRLMEEAKKSESSSSSAKQEQSLLDAYEVQSISRHLNSLIIESPSNHNKHVINTSLDHVGGRKMDQKKNMKKKKVRKGFWGLRHGVVCGREEDVVNPIALREDHGKSVNLVKLPINRGSL